MHGRPGFAEDIELAITRYVADDDLMSSEIRRQNDMLLPLPPLAIDILPQRPTRWAITVEISQGKCRGYRITNGHVVDTRQISIEDKALRKERRSHHRYDTRRPR